MTRKGSVTVFLTLVLGLILALVSTSIQSARMAAARTQILCSTDVGLYSLFGQYDRKIMEEYDLFVLDGSCGGGELKMAEIYDNIESYIKPVLKQNSQNLSITSGGFSGYRLLTDDQGYDFYHQVTKYMKETLGSQGIQLLLNKMNERKQKTLEAEKTGRNTEEKSTLDSYEAEMTEAAKNSQEAKEKAELEAGNAFSDGQNQVISPPVKNVVNPINIIKRIMKMGILELVVPVSKGISDKKISGNILVSERDIQKGLSMGDEIEKDFSYTSQILFQQYLMEKLGNCQKPSAKGLAYQMEYVLFGKESDQENLKAVAKRLLLIREGVNFTTLLADAGKRAQVQTLALAIASTFLIPPAASVIEAALLLCWSFAESVLDVRELFAGGKIPLVKSYDEWQLSLQNLPYLLDVLDSDRRSVEQGMTYEDYLQVLLLTQNIDNKISRGMDMLELEIREKTGNDDFRLDSCITGIEVQIDVNANQQKELTVTKQYCY